eukprot:scaffold1130_cov74-Phaeocystis_antarctica.AAC.11
MAPVGTRTRAWGKNPRITCSSSSRASNPTLSASFLLTSAPGKRASRPSRILAMDRGERAGRLACQMIRCSPADLNPDVRPRGPSMHAS